MFIKLTDSYMGTDLYVNTNAISAITRTDIRDDGDQSRVFITGEVVPFYVRETVAEIVKRLRDEGECE